MAILWTIIVGFFVGLVARAIMPGTQKMGFIMTSILGIAGSLVAMYGGSALEVYDAGSIPGFVGSVVGALVLLFAYEFLRKRR